MKRFTVNDGCNAFYLEDSVTGLSACMGDGVDQEGFGEIGTETFRQAWEDEANENAHEYFEAYFTSLYELEIWCDRDLVVVFTGEQTGKYPDVLVVIESLDMSRFSEAISGPHLGQRARFLSLSQKMQRYIAERLV